MATICPFRGLRFNAAVGTLNDIVAPPYDVLSQEERDRYAAKEAHNIVRLTLPEEEPDDRNPYVKYARSAARLEEWRRESALAPEELPSFYRYTQTFTIPGTTKSFVRQSLIVSLKLEPYANGVVLPHEQTFPKHKEDRLRILEATRSHLECIYGLYEDPDRSVFDLVSGAPAAQLADMATEDGVGQKLERIDDPQAVAAIVQAMADKKLWIADGHHRYETALNFRAQFGEVDHPVAEDYMMMAISSMSDPGLVLLPTHRILKTMPVGPDELKARLAETFQIEEAPNAELMARIEALSGKVNHAFGVALPGGTGLVATSGPSLAPKVDGDGSDRLKGLDVSVLHGFIFEKLLGLTGLEFFSYTRDEREAIEAVDKGAPAAFLMNPPTVDDMRAIAQGGERMPQKSTYYYPKLLSGLVIWSLKDFGG